MEEMEVNNPEDISFIDNDKEKDELSEDSENAMVEGEVDNQENEDDNDDNDDDDDDDDDNQTALDEAEVKKLQQKLSENPYDYNCHVSLISKLSKMGELDRLRISRENMSSKYPLSPDLWLSWLRDEMKLAVSPEDRLAVEKLCERAVKDYLSIEVWLEYLQFSIGSMESDDNKNGIIKVRELFERALTSAGLHVTKGAIIWEAFREFEVVLLSMTSPDDIIERKNQLDRIGALFRRQLACPLLNMEKTWEEYEKWRCEDGKTVAIDDETIGKTYKSALEKLSLRLPFEDKLVSSQNDSGLFDFYKAYVLFEKGHGDPGRLTVLYERAITDLSLESQLWLDYINYIEENIKIEEIQAPLYERATRNIPWYSEIWIKWLRALEKWGRPLLEVQNILELALVVEFQSTEDYRNIWMTYLEYLRRSIDESSSERDKQMEVLDKAFNRACEHLAKSFGLEGDPECIVLQYWARTEAIHGNNMEKARSLWSDIMSQGHSGSAASWLEYISLEKCYGDTKHLRKLYQKALGSVKDWPESIGNSWINFERDEGTLEQMEVCQRKIKQRLEKINEEREKAQSDFSRKATKRKENTGDYENSGVPLKKLSKIDKNEGRGGKSLGAVKINEKIGHNKKISSPPRSELTEDESMDTSQEIDEKRTVFISNLDYTTTEIEVREALKPVGSITQFRMIKDFKGRSKGFCYVELSNPIAVEEALKLDRVPINGRPMFVSRCDPNKTTRGNAFKYNSSLEKNKLFVKGLSLKTTKEDLEKLFSTYGKLKDVRIVTYRNGHSKGLAYVEFEDANSASKALLGADGSTVDDKVISVAISKPPERKKTSEDSLIKSLGGTTVSRTHFGVPKTLLSMIPRNVKQVATNGTSVSQEERKPLNNQDFRSMLLNNKRT